MSLSGLNSLEQFNPYKFKPTDLDFIYYIMFEKGVTLDKFNVLPIPYIINMVSVYAYLKEEEIKAHKRAMRKKK
jgi:hypothetical protein